VVSAADNCSARSTRRRHVSRIIVTNGFALSLSRSDPIRDIGRHNAVDKIVGDALLKRRLPLADHILLVSGRGGFEIVQKAIVAGIPLLASVSAPSDLAVQLARELDLTLVGFLRGERFNVYAGEQRILTAQGAVAVPAV